MSTKNHPGQFRCHEAALPDEPMFVILGRDPAGPATLEYWAQQRIQQGKVHEPDDRDRIKAAVDRARDMAEWRQRMLDHADELGEQPAWKLPRPADLDDRPPVRMAIPQSGPEGSVKPRNEFMFDRRAGDATLIQVGDMESVALSELTDFWLANRPQAEPREIAMRPELGMGYSLPPTDIAVDPTFREKIAIGLSQVTQDMQAYFGGDEIALPYDDWIRVKTQALTFVDRLNGYAAELNASKVDPYETFAAHLHRQQRKSQTYDYYPDPDGDPVKVTPLSFTRMSELLDYATCYGEFDEHTPNGTISKYGEGMSSPMNDIRRNAIWVMKRFMGIIPEGTEPPEYDDTPKTPVAEVIVQGVVRVGGQDYSIEHLERILAGQSLPKGLHNPKDKERIAELEGEIAALKITKDSEPEDLAHAPEVPHHRFSVFHTSGDYAYARGLEVNPMHLPTALDAMAKSGWHLCAIFGRTDAQHIGFIFRRSTPVLVPSRFGDVWPPAPAREPPSELLRAYQEGRSFEEIAKEECPDGDEDCLRRIGLGRGLTP